MGDVLDGYPVQVAVADTAAQAAFSAPRTVGSYGHLKIGIYGFIFSIIFHNQATICPFGELKTPIHAENFLGVEHFWHFIIKS